MAVASDIFSIRLVIADFYMEKPVMGLDPCYSELRGKQINRVPIIRIFGANAKGQKSCMHIHGVFPYFYIPYHKRDFKSSDHAILQIAIALDKAINISLGQGSSSTQHVFKIQLVKGIPFYGYHRGEHQFLKIYMFNPRFVRRAANLLQNNVILNKTFNPHESHVPYILQFMIDYNLYGMSYLHVPLEFVKLRRSSEDEVASYPNISPEQLLDPVIVKKVSCSALELDINSMFILNRFQLIHKSNSKQTNPGIEAIWNDERVRRQKLAQNYEIDEANLQAIPVLEVPPTQDRPNVVIAESDNFHRTALQSKLLTMEQTISEDLTLNSTSTDTTHTNVSNTTLQTSYLSSIKEQRRKFNLHKYLINSVYPDECSQEEGQLVNASFIENHMSNSSSLQSIAQHNTSKEAAARERACLDETTVDEELVLSLTQPTANVPYDATLTENDLELLDVLQKLEEQNGQEGQIDLDSSLAPLSQPHNEFELSPELLDKGTARAATNQLSAGNADSDEEVTEGNVLDFSTALDDIDELLLKLTQSQSKQRNETNKGEQAEKITFRETSSTNTVHYDDTLTEKDLELLEVLQQLEEQNKQESKTDISLKKCEDKTNLLDKKLPPVIAEPDTESDKALEFSVALENTDEMQLKLTPTPPTQILKQPEKSDQVPQIDGANDFLPRTPKKSSANLKTTSPSTPSTPKGAGNSIKSPRTPKSSAAKKYAPLPLIFTSKSAQKPADQIPSEPALQTPISQKHTKSSSVSLRKKLAMTDLRRKSISATVQDTDESTTLRRSSRIRNLDKTHIACALRPLNKKLRMKDLFEEAAQVTEAQDNIEECFVPIEKSKSGRSLGNRKKPVEKDNVVAAEVPTDVKPKQTSLQASPEISSAHVSEDEAIVSDTESDVSTIKLRKTPNLRRLRRSFRDSLLANAQKTPRQNIEVNDAQKTPSLNIKFNDEQKLSLELCTPTTKDSIKATKPSEITSTPVMTSPVEKEASTPTLIESFYEHSLLINSPSVFSDCGVASPSPASTPVDKEKPVSMPKTSGSSTNSAGVGSLVITPLELPPTYEEVLQGCRKFDIHEHEFQQPFYGNSADVTKMKEVGFIVLQIPGNKLNDYEPFQSVLGNDIGLADWRRKRLIEIGGPALLQRLRGEQHAREFFSTGQQVCIEPVQCAPSRVDAKVWLKARELLKHKGDTLESKPACSDGDSPIKIKRQKVTMMVHGGEETAAGSGDEDIDCNSSLTLTPMTPAISQPQSQVAETKLTPVSSKVSSGTKQRRSSRRGTKLCFKAQCNQLKGAAATATDTHHSDVDSVELVGSQESNKSTVSSEQSAASSAVLAALERSSFARHVQNDGERRVGSEHELSFGLTSLNNTFGFKVDLENLQQAKADIECNYLTTITLELFVPTRGELLPDPLHDEIRCLFYAIEHSVPLTSLPSKACGYIIVNSAEDIVSEARIHGIDADIEIQVVHSEVEAFEALLALCARWDPDIYAGYEIEMSSWGYVIERAKYLCLNITPLLSRVPSQKVHITVDEDRETYTDLDMEMKICGRILLDVWRLMRSEIALTSYTFENVMYHIMHKRCPQHSHRSLTTWFESPCTRWIVLEYYLERVRGTLLLLDQLDLLGRTSEMAKLIGIQFYEVLSRGSQFRVESMMLRIAKPKNLVPFSPSVQQRAHMRAPEYLALIMEPQSRFYADPMIVLDFQSLYPSMIIGYNYCFSTCLGRVEHLGHSTPFEFGASLLQVPPKMLQKLLDEDLVTVSPCGVVFVKASVREGILPRMLREILDTRLMVKQSMKIHKHNSALQRILHSRQLGLKLTANVTYGYTAANFSGRMPSVEVGDSVVSKGRETLEQAIKLVDANDKWNVRVVYGDTDSMFVLVPGRNRAQAFEIGEQIAEAVTKMNPHPVKLKLEKVYQPCILQTKKRYVGYMYETPDQQEPIYEAKGIETVRRDGCPAVAKILEKVLRILFETANVSQVKQYVCRQFTKLLSGRANLQDLIFAKEFRGLNGYKPTACVPALELTRKWMKTDPRHIPRRGERVPFIIANGAPGVQLIRLVRSPHELLANEGQKFNAIYYITKAIIPPLNRCLLLIGADVNEWFSNLPRKLLLTPAFFAAGQTVGKLSKKPCQKSTISQYFSNTNCVIDCGRQAQAGICIECSQDARKCFVILHTKIAKLERAYYLTQQICQSCCGRVGSMECVSLDCPVLFVMEVKRRSLQQIEYFRRLLDGF